MGTQEAGSAGDENAFAAFVKSRHEILPSVCDINNFATPILLKTWLMQSKGPKVILKRIRFVLCGAYAGLMPPFATLISIDLSARTKVRTALSASRGRFPAVDQKHVACDEGGLFRGQKQNRVCNLAWFPDALHRHPPQGGPISYLGFGRHSAARWSVCGPH
jgi:hypothetical protein